MPVPRGFERVEEVVPPGFEYVGPAEPEEESVIPPGFERVGPAPSAKKEDRPIETEDVSFLQSAKESMMERGTWAGAGGMAGAGVGSILGGAAGTMLGPPGIGLGAIKGGIIGGGIGAAAGSAALDSFTALKAMLEGKPEDVPGLQEQLGAMAGEAALDVGFGMGGAVAQPIRAARALLARASGITSAASKAIQEKAARLGIGLGAVDVGRTLPKGYAKVMGVFPWTGSPFRKQEIAKHGDVEKRIAKTLDTFGPNKTLTDLGIDMVEAARGTHRTFRETADALYQNVTDAIEQAARQDIIPTENTRKVAKELLEKVKRGEIILQDGRSLPRVAAEGVEKYLSELPLLPETLTPHQYTQLKKDLSDFIGKTLKDGWDVKQLTQVKGALETDFRSLRLDLLPPGQGEAIQDAFQTADKFYSKGIVKFRTPSAKAFERVDKTIFKAGAEDPGALNADEIYNAVIKSYRSPTQIRNLARLVGKDNMKKAASHHFETAVTNSRLDVPIMGDTFSIVDPAMMERELGLVGLTKKKHEAITQMYKFAGVDIKDVTDLVDVMKKIEGISNPADFVRRRVIMSGVRGMTAVAGFGAGAGLLAKGMGEKLMSLTFLTVLARHASKIFASPYKLKRMTTALDEALDVSVRRAAMGRLVKTLVQEGDPDGGELNLEELEVERRPAVGPGVWPR